MLSNYRLPPDTKAILFEANLRKESWLSVSVYKSLTINISVTPCQTSGYLLKHL